MFRSRSTIDTATRSDARHQAEIISWWRDWHRWLLAQLQLLDAREAEATTPPSFEQTEGAWEQQRAEAEQTMRRIPHDRCIVFERTRENCRTQTEAEGEADGHRNGGTPQAHDPDTLEREILTRLLAQAEGTSDGLEQWGAVPLPTGWYQLRVDALLHAPAAAEYAVAPDESDGRRKQIALIAGLLLLGCVTVWWTWPRGAGATPPSRATDLLVNGQVVARWPVRSVTVVDAADERTTLLASAAAGLASMTLGPEDQRAEWSTTALRPLELCLPAAVLETAQLLELHGERDVPIRRYSLAQNRVSRPDLVVHACGTGPASGLRSGVLVGTTALPDQPRAAPVTLSSNGPELALQHVDVLGPGQDPQMADDKYRVVVRVAAPAGIDWTVLAPRLVLRTGLELLPSDLVASDAGSDVTDVSYLAPAWQSSMEAAWSVTDPQTNEQVRWRVILDPPASRGEVLREALDLTVSATRGAEPGSMSVHLTLRNTSTTPLVLTNADLAITQADRAIPVTAAGTAGLTIAPLDRRTLDLPLRGIDPTREISVRVGAAGFRLRFEEQERGTASTDTRP